MSRPFKGCVLALGLVTLCTTQSVAYAAVATFDSLSEGFSGTELIDGGIRFFDPDWYIPGEQTVMAVDRADGNLGDSPYFTSPNGLGLGGYVPGPNGGGSRFGSISFELESGGRGNAASIDVFVNQLDRPNRLVLAAYLGGVLVAAAPIHDRLLRGARAFFRTSPDTAAGSLTLQGHELGRCGDVHRYMRLRSNH